MATVTDELAQHGFAVLHSILADGLTWEGADSMENAMFERLGLQAKAILEGQEATEARQRADDIFQRTRRWLGLAETHLSEEPERTQLAWEALVRFLFAVVDADGEPNDLEDVYKIDWKSWAETRLKGAA